MWGSWAICWTNWKTTASISDFVQSEEERLLSRLSDLRYAARRYQTRFTFFLNERERALLEAAMQGTDREIFRFWGGYPSAERTILGAFPPDRAAQEEEFPIAAVGFSYRKQDELTHRDFLGALLAQGRKRETLGDILIRPGMATVLVHRAHLQELLTVEKVGRVGVRGELLSFPLTDLPQAKTEPVGGVVASLRLDCVTALAAGVSREKAAGLIKSGLVSVNHLPQISVSHPLTAGDILTVRGSGKFRLTGEPRPTKKGRLFLTLEHYI